MEKALYHKDKLWHIALSIGICLLIASCLFFFVKSYSALNISLRDERAVYVNEITGQLTRSITAKREWLMSRIGSSASSFNQSSVATFAQAKRLFEYKQAENYTVLLVGDTGSTYSLDGQTAQIRNFDILTATLASGKAQYHFDKSSDGVDYWVFSSPVEPRRVDHVNVVAIYEVYNVEQFRGDLRLGIFGDDGYTYILDLYGGIQLGPTVDLDYVGYNLISSMRKAGLNSSVADHIEADIRHENADSMFAHFNGTDWAVQYAPLADSNEMTFVIAPIAATSQETTATLRNTLLSVGGAIIGLALLVLVTIVSNARAAKERDRQMYELELKNRVASTKNDFLAKMSHDIRTPLNAIIGMNYIATTQVDEHAPVMDYLRQIDLSSQYLLGILNDILDMSKIESGKMELRYAAFKGQDVIDAIVSVSRMQAEKKGVSFSVLVDDQLSAAYIGDKQRLAQILMNLTSNAVKFTERGGRIDVRFTLEERGESRDKIRLTVEDTGIGMTEEYMENLFVPFTQDRSNVVSSMGGSGLGLSIVKSFVDMMDGTISVKSKKGEGSAFSIIIELKRASLPEISEGGQLENIDESVLKEKRVLLVEDNEINLVIAEKIITRFGPIVDTAPNGLLALEKYKESDIGYYDLIITDIQMPEMNGYELTDAVRALKRPDARVVPILAMSANAFDDDIQKSLLRGMNAHLKKPVEVPQLKAALLKYLGGGNFK